MTIYIGSNKDIKFYKGDSGNIKIDGIPTDKSYNVYFTARDYNRNTVILEKMVESGGNSSVVFSFSAEDTSKFIVGRGATYTTYKWGLKICDPDTGTEDTLIPSVTFDTSGNPIFSKPVKIYVYPLYVEGETNNG